MKSVNSVKTECIAIKHELDTVLGRATVFTHGRIRDRIYLKSKQRGLDSKGYLINTYFLGQTRFLYNQHTWVFYTLAGRDIIREGPLVSAQPWSPNWHLARQQNALIA